MSEIPEIFYFSPRHFTPLQNSPRFLLSSKNVESMEMTGVASASEVLTMCDRFYPWFFACLFRLITAFDDLLPLLCRMTAKFDGKQILQPVYEFESSRLTMSKPASGGLLPRKTST